MMRVQGITGIEKIEETEETEEIEGTEEGIEETEETEVEEIDNRISPTINMTIEEVITEEIDTIEEHRISRKQKRNKRNCFKEQHKAKDQHSSILNLKRQKLLMWLSLKNKKKAQGLYMKHLKMNNRQ